MKYITRELHGLMQGGLGDAGDRAAAAAWDRASVDYRSHLERIQGQLPPGMRAFSQLTLHDGIVQAVSRPSDKELLLDVDATSNPWGPRGNFRLRFNGVRELDKEGELLGQGWLYEEVHLHPEARFEFHVMFWDADFRVAADEIEVQELP